jgi:hypothetical protein
MDNLQSQMTSNFIQNANKTWVWAPSLQDLG